MLVVMMMGSVGVKAADYVFMYDNGYLAVGNNGAITYATTFSPQCVWTCVSNIGTLAAATLSNSTSNYLYTTIGNTKYWLVNNTTNGNAINTTSNASNASAWRNNNDGRLYLASGTRYVYYRGSFWRTSNTNSSWTENNNYGSYRSTTYQVTTTPHDASTIVTVPTISPASAELDFNGSQQFTASSTATTTPAYTKYEFNSTTHYYFNGTDYSSETDMKASSSWTTAAAAPTVTYEWTLSGSANSKLSPTSGTGGSITITHSTQAAADVSSTLSVTASVTANGKSDSKSSTSNATVTAMAPKTDPESLTVTTPMTVYVGQTGTVSYTLTPSPCYNNVTFASSATGVATVSSDGTVTGMSAGTATITVTAKKIDGTTNASLTKTVTVNVKDKVATPVITFTPDANDNTKATASITCTTPETTIYYKVNTGDYAVFSSNFNVNENDVVSAYAVKTSNPDNLWDQSDETTNTYVSCTTAAPTISYVQSGITSTVTITAEAGATIYYTTNGDNPTTSSTSGTTTVTINSVAGGTTVKAIAKSGTCQVSEIKEIITPGVSSGTVILNDLEDHKWSYYSDASTPAQLHSLNPADVKITYYGDGIMMTDDADYTSGATTGWIRKGDNSNNYVGGAKVNVGGENENTFVYYKTLERGANTDAAWTFSTDHSSAASRCPYKPIPNPFQVRPTYGGDATTSTADWAGWRGFQCWRLKSFTGGAVYSAASGGTALSVGAVINAETEIYFAPNAEYGMEVELEAVWAIAYVVKTNTEDDDRAIGDHSSVGCERNFIVLNTTNANYNFGGTSGKRITNIDRQVTVTRYLPNGVRGQNNDATYIRGAGGTNMTLQANTKFENVAFNMSSYTLNADGHDVVLGRGVTGTIHYLESTSGSTSPLNCMLRLESGTIDRLTFLRYGNESISGRVTIRSICGCDYDRAKGDNTKLTVSKGSSLFFDYQGAIGAPNKDMETFNLVVKSGKYQENYWVDGDDASYTHTFYCGGNSSGETNYPGVRYVTVEGGEMGSMNGGRGVGSTDAAYATPEVIAFDVRVKGGLFHGSVYGSAADSPSRGSRRIVITGGEIQSWVAGGANGVGGEATRYATVVGDSYVYVGGNVIVGGSRARTVNNTRGGNVFGASRGKDQEAAINTSNVVIADNAEISNSNYPVDGGNVYGGGFSGFAKVQSNVYILGGTVSNSVYGGGYGCRNANETPEANIWMTGGTVLGGIYGGNNTVGKTKNVNMYINGGTVGSPSAPANVHGGGYGKATAITGNINIVVGTQGATSGVTIYGDVYGGSALGQVNATATVTPTYNNNGYVSNATISDVAFANNTSTNVTMNKGTINGSLYGGALGDNSTAANVYGPVAVKVYGGSVNTTTANGSGAVYGCNNINGAPQSTVTVDIYGTDPAPDADHYALDAVYGGGNQAAYTYGNGYPTVTVHNCGNSIAYVYGGGNAAAVASTDVKIYGGNVIGNVFGGGNGTAVAANFVMVTGAASTNIYGGTIRRVFAGNNANGLINGNVSLNINKQIESGDGHTLCDMRIGEVYGGGNLAVSKAPKTFTIGCTGELTTDHAKANAENNIANYRIGYDLEGIGSVFGGANQAAMNGNISLAINSGIIANVFGGNNTSGNITGDITVNIEKNDNATCASNWYVGNVFGGGNLAEYTGSPAVNINNGTVTYNVYGGGKGDPNDHTKGQVTGNPVVTIGDLTSGHESYEAIVTGDVYGGGDAGNVVGTPVVNVVNKCNTSVGYVYGGGNAADVNGTDVNINGGNITGMVFGGGHGDKNSSPQKEADVNGNVAVDVTGGTINKVFGGSNSKGNISGDVTVNIAKDDNSCEMHITEVYGGGNEAAGNAGTITIGCTGDYENNGEGIGDVYGGANAADINNDISLAIRGGHIDRVFGGNNSSGAINGTIAVEVNWDNALTCDKYLGNVFGGGNLAAYTGSPTVTLTNGTVSHSVYGGGNEAGVGGSTVNINGGSVLDGVYGGCNTSGTVDGDILVNLTGGTVGAANAKAYVHGGGYGKNTATSGNVDVNINGASLVIYGDVYGGSALGDVNSDTNDYTHVTLTAGTIHGDAYGGGLGSTSEPAWVFGNVKVTQNGVIFIKSIATEKNADGSDIVNGGRIFGCNNLNGSPKGTVLVLVKKTTPTSGTDHVEGTYDMAAVYGGGNLAAYDPTTPTATGQYTTDHTAANKPLQVVIDGCTDISIEYVYGGGNAAATPATDVVVLGAYELGNVFGGGNGKDKISYDGTTWTANPGADVGIIDQTAYAANSSTGTYGTGESLASLLGGTIHYAFGGSNTKGNVLSEATVYLNESDGGCPLKIDEVYGGGNEAYMAGDTQIQLGCISYLKEIYGGAKAADLGGNVVLTITSGSFDRVFGGNNVSGCINGSITVNIEETGCHPIVIGELYAGGNQAGYSIYGYKEVTEGGKQVWKPRESATDAGTGPTTAYDSPVLNVKSFTSIGRIFGGGFGEPAVMVGDPTVNINEVEGTKSNKNVTDGTYTYDTNATTGHFDTNGNFKGWAIEYKDDSLNPTTVTSTVNVPTHNKGKIGAIGTVFGGGNAAKVIGNTNVNIGTLSKITYVSGTDSSEKDVIGVDIRENVFGGGNQADVTGNTNVVVGK